MEINNKALASIYSRFFVFKKAKELVAFDKNDNLVFIPTKETFTHFVKKNFDLFIYDLDEEEDSKKEALITTGIYHDVLCKNQYDILNFKRDPFAKRARVETNDNVISYIAPGVFLPEKKWDVTEEQIDRVVTDYKKHFLHFDDLIEWIVACRFNEARRNSFLYLRVNAGFGKSLLMSIFADLMLSVEVKEPQLKNKSASELTPAMFRNAFALFIDEFTHFFQDLKDITHYTNIAAKFALQERVELYAKIFLSAEKSTSFFGEAGVDPQIAERCSLMDLTNTNKKIDKNELYNENTTLYVDCLKAYTYKKVKELVDKYVKLGRHKASAEARKFMNEFQEKFKIEANTIQKIQDALKDTVKDFVEYSILSPETKNRNMEQLKEHIYIVNDLDVAIKNPTAAFEKMIKMQGEQFAKVAKFKQTVLEEIFESDYKQRKIKGDNIRCYLFRYREPSVEVKDYSLELEREMEAAFGK